MPTTRRLCLGKPQDPSLQRNLQLLQQELDLPAAFPPEVERLAAIAASGMQLPDRDRTVWRMRQAYARALRSDPLARGWTLEAPRWWRETSTVTARRALSAYDRARLLRHRRPPA